MDIILTLPDTQQIRLRQIALDRGFHSEAALLRSLADDLTGNPNPFTAFSEVTRRFLKDRERWVLAALEAEPLTVAQMCKATGKFNSSLSPVVKALLGRGAIVERDAAFTGGRPATVYAIAPVGTELLRMERQRREALYRKSSQHRLELQAELDKLNRSKANWALPSNLVGTPEGIFIQALLDKGLTPEQIGPIHFDALTAIGGEQTTWGGALFYLEDAIRAAQGLPPTAVESEATP